MVLACAGCGAPRTSTADAESLVAVERLPAERRALLSAYGRGGADWEAAREQALRDPAATRFLVENLLLEMMRSYDAFAARTDERARAAFLRAETELARFGAAAAAPLVELLCVGDGIVADLATKSLVRIGREAVASAEPALEHTEPKARRRVAALFAVLPHAGEREPAVREALRRRALGDPEWIVRAEAALALGARGSRDVETAPWRLILERALVDDDPAVRRSAAEGLFRLGDPRAIPALANAMARAVTEGEVKLLAVIESALAELAGDRRSRTPQAWLDWWRDHRGEFSNR
ncbi:MAG: HEAT repeat domain-containing protein [Planctomycetes bacterium]|nr:HEAT repeat domain-containing protein [Planctomycetota bacterium]